MVAVQRAAMQLKQSSLGFTYVLAGLEEGDLGRVAVTCSSDRKAGKMLRFRKAMKKRTQSLQKSLGCLCLENWSSGPCSSERMLRREG